MIDKPNDKDLKWLKDQYPLTDEEKDIVREWLIKCDYGQEEDDMPIEDILEYKPEQAYEFLQAAKKGELWGRLIIDMWVFGYN